MMTGTRQDPGSDLRSERDRFVAFSFAAADLLLEVDDKGIIRFASGAARSMTGHDADHLIGQAYTTIFALQDQRYVAVLIERLALGHRLDPVAVKTALPDGGASDAILGGCRLPRRDRSLHLTLTIPHHPSAAEGVTTLRDAASGLLEREPFEAAAGRTMQRQNAQQQAAKLTLLRLVGLDDLRSRAGDAAADGFLGEVGAFLRASSAGGDAAGRLATDKFGLVHAETVDPGSVSSHVHQLSQQADPEGRGIPVDHGTIDLALGSMTEADAAKALAYAIGEFAQARGDTFKIDSLDTAFRVLLRDTVARIGALKGTVSERRFDIAFQPIVDLATRAVKHHEVLARIDGGRSPYALVTFAEGVGMIEEFDLAVCQRAVEFLRDAGSSSIVIAVNLSGRSLESALFAEALLALLAPHEALWPRLQFELTESTQIDNLEQVNGVIQALRKRGHRFALDDFGAGASSFPYLHALTVDFVKIDGAYVQRMLSGPRDAAILRSIVMLCRELGVKTIAEMVETEAQARELKTLGVDYGQGYLFGKPGARPVGMESKVALNASRTVTRQGGGRRAN